MPSHTSASPTARRLLEASKLRRDEVSSWILTALIAALAFALRIINVSRPSKIVFDETYYAKDAWALVNLGYEAKWPEGANDAIARGDVHGYQQIPEMFVHPQLGKWLIGAGEHLFGMTSFGWRISAVVFGTILVIATIRLARRCARSTAVGLLAGLFLCFDGLAFVMSRIALLDGFQAAFTVAAVAAIAADRDYLRTKIGRHLVENRRPNLAGSFGPLVAWRPWLLVAGVFFGLACACKWNSIYVLAVFGIATVIYDIEARLDARAGRESLAAIWRNGPLDFCYLVLTAAICYVASWWSWFTHPNSWSRGYGTTHPEDFWVRTLGDGAGSFVHLHEEIWNFHTGDWIASQTHSYDAAPATWPVMGRTIGIDAVNDIQPGVEGCPAVQGETCLRVISGMGTPTLWWLAAAAMIVGIIWWLFGRNRLVGIPVMAALTPWLGWFPNADRPVFFFYAIMLIPFSATVLAMVLGRILGPRNHPKRKLRAGIIVGVLVLVIANFWFIYPILTDQLMTRSAWSLRMWFRSWI